jgi:hypothetical protein
MIEHGISFLSFERAGRAMRKTAGRFGCGFSIEATGDPAMAIPAS